MFLCVEIHTICVFCVCFLQWRHLHKTTLTWAIDLINAGVNIQRFISKSLATESFLIVITSEWNAHLDHTSYILSDFTLCFPLCHCYSELWRKIRHFYLIGLKCYRNCVIRTIIKEWKREMNTSCYVFLICFVIFICFFLFIFRLRL